MIKRVLTIIISMLMILSSLSLYACNKQPDNSGINRNKEISKITENSVSDYKIVHSSSASESIKFAVSELKVLVKEITGATLESCDDNGLVFDNNSKYISLGKTKVLETANLDIDYEPLKDNDGFILKTKGQTLFIDGSIDRGVVYGVYDFLEQVTGLRFIAYDCTYIPEMKTLPLYEIDRLQVPDFSYRSYQSAEVHEWGAGLYNAYDPQFVARMRVNGKANGTLDNYGGSLQKLVYTGGEAVANAYKKNYSFGHNSLYYVDPDIYLEDHPEMFALKNGQVRDVCLSNGITADGKIDETMEVSAIKVAVETLKKEIDDVAKNHPEVEYYMFGQMDNETPCMCSECLANLRKYNNRRSALSTRFVNILASEGQKYADEKYPGRKVKMVYFAYVYSDKGPVDSEYKLLDETCKPRDNCYVWVCPLRADYYLPLDDKNQPAEVSEIFKTWENVHDKFWTWMYNCDFYNYLWYMPSIHGMQDSFRLMKDFGSCYMNCQSADNSFLYEDKNMETYVAMKLMWNTEQSVQELRDEFIYHYYGPASEKIKEYYNTFDALIDEQFRENGLRYGALGAVGGVDNIYKAKYYPFETMQKLQGLIDEGISLAEKDTTTNKDDYVRRLRNLRLVPSYMILHNFDSYYENVGDAKRAKATEFFDECDDLGLLYWAQNKGIDSLRGQYL